MFDERRFTVSELTIGRKFRIVSAGPVGNIVRIVGIEGKSTRIRTEGHTVKINGAMAVVPIVNDPGRLVPAAQVEHHINAGHWISEG